MKCPSGNWTRPGESARGKLSQGGASEQEAECEKDGGSEWWAYGLLGEQQSFTVAEKELGEGVQEVREVETMLAFFRSPGERVGASERLGRGLTQVTSLSLADFIRTCGAHTRLPFSTWRQ